MVKVQPTAGPHTCVRFMCVCPLSCAQVFRPLLVVMGDGIGADNREVVSPYALAQYKYNVQLLYARTIFEDVVKVRQAM